MKRVAAGPHVFSGECLFYFYRILIGSITGPLPLPRNVSDRDTEKMTVACTRRWYISIDRPNSGRFVSDRAGSQPNLENEARRRDVRHS